MIVATATELLMPRLSDSMEVGTILAWLVDAGSMVRAGEDLLEVETDKATMTVQAEDSGVLEILAEEGSTIAVGVPIARLGPSSGAGPAPSAEDPPPTPPAPVEAITDDRRPPQELNPGGAGGSPRTTPLARRIAAIHGVTIAALGDGSGLGGRIVKADVLAVVGVTEPPPTPPPAPTPPAEPAPAAAASGAGVVGAKGAAAVVEPTRLQAVIARRMAEAKATVPHFQVSAEVRMDATIAMRAELKRLADGEPAPSLNDFVVRACALALREYPKANGSYRDGAFELHDRVNVGIAVAAADTLVVPTIADADRKSLGEIGREARRLAERVRSGEVTPPELAGGTFTVSNLGMYGMTAIYPVINQPQAAILGVGAIRQVLVRGEEGQIADASMLTLTLSCDHRILYGSEAAGFLNAIRDRLANPLRVAL